jgi:hypothetical protein
LTDDTLGSCLRRKRSRRITTSPRGAPVAASQSRTVTLSKPDTTSLPSGEKATELTQPEWPLGGSPRGAPVATSQSWTVPSNEPDATSLPSGEKATDLTRLPSGNKVTDMTESKQLAVRRSRGRVFWCEQNPATKKVLVPGKLWCQHFSGASISLVPAFALSSWLSAVLLVTTDS